MINYSIIIPFRNDLDLLNVGLATIPDREDIQVIIVDNSNISLESQFKNQHKLAIVNYLTSSSTKGAGCARNVGLEKAEGKWLLFMDADDFFTPVAFSTFDRYVNADAEIIFFDMTSVYLGTNKHSPRLDYYSKRIKRADENIMRYRSANPVGKMVAKRLVDREKIKFQEVSVSNDSWFSLQTGYYAIKVLIDSTVVYCATESGEGGSLVKTINPENSYTRFAVAVKRNKFLESVNLHAYRSRLLAMVIYAYKNHGAKVFFMFIRLAIKERENIFTGMTHAD